MSHYRQIASIIRDFGLWLILVEAINSQWAFGQTDNPTETIAEITQLLEARENLATAYRWRFVAENFKGRMWDEKIVKNERNARRILVYQP